MRVLALDTSGAAGSIAVVEDGRVRSAVRSEITGPRGDTLVPLVREALERSGLVWGDLHLLAVGLGPGAFTGVRVGVAAAKALALATGLPLVGVVSLEALAEPHLRQGSDVVAAVTDARKGEIYAALFEGRARRVRLAPLHAAADEAGRRIARAVAPGTSVRLVGDALSDIGHCGALTAALADHGPSLGGTALVEAADVARIGVERFEAGAVASLEVLEPVYVRPADARLPAPSQGSPYR